MHTNCKISNLAHACLRFLCKISIKTPRETGALNSYHNRTYKMPVPDDYSHLGRAFFDVRLVVSHRLLLDSE